VKTRDRALKVFEEIAELGYQVGLERVPPNGKRQPAEYILCVRARDFGLTELARMTKLAKSEELSMSIAVHGKSPVLVLA
jgi:hypothetical protein